MFFFRNLASAEFLNFFNILLIFIMLFRKTSSEQFNIPGGTSGVLYPASPKKDQSIALVTMDGAYPENGWSINSKCTETLLVLEGVLRLEVKEVWHELSEGDLFVIEPGNKYRTEGKCRVVDFITPAWNKEQNKIIN